MWYISRDLHPAYHSSNANIGKYTVARMSAPMKLQRVKPITESTAVGDVDISMGQCKKDVTPVR